MVRTNAVKWSGIALAGITGFLTVAHAGADEMESKVQMPAPFSDALDQLLADRQGEPVKAWVFLKDKGFGNAAERHEAILKVAADYSPRTVERRRSRGTQSKPLFDATDLSVADKYVQAIEAIGLEIHIQSRWLNAVSVTGTRTQLEDIARLGFVESLQPVNRSTGISYTIEKTQNNLDGGFYGNAEDQLNQINVINLHDAGFTGDGMIIGILDTGFRTTHEVFTTPGHELQVVAAWDFVNDDDNVGIEPGDDDGQHSHGTLILGTLAAYKPNTFVGTAYDASFVLAKTEDITDEYQGEEDFYVAGLEFIELNGADVATSSLGYIDWYSQSDLDGQTAVTTIAVNIATGKGLHCCTAAGNAGHDEDPGTSHLIAPADAFQVFTCGAVESTGEIAGFSSDGPTADGRVKPEILAQGKSTETIDPYDDNGYASASGTSLSTPLVAGAVACVTQARPHWTVDEMRDNVLTTGDWYVLNGTYDSDFVYGYGVMNTYDASQPMTVLDIAPGIAGQSNTLSAEGGTPGERVHFVWGKTNGVANVPGCSGVQVTINSPKIAGSAIADANGDVALNRVIPAGASGLFIKLQALEMSSCRVSNRIDQTIQ